MNDIFKMRITNVSNSPLLTLNCGVQYEPIKSKVLNIIIKELNVEYFKQKLEY